MPPRPEEKEEIQIDGLKVFDFHGVDNIQVYKGDADAVADCPFCGATKKFGINKETTKFNCFVCATGGNEHTFVRALWDLSFKTTMSKRYDRLANDSGFLFGSSARDWGVCQHTITDEWCIPGYNKEKKVTGLYVFRKMKTNKGTWKHLLLPSPRLGHHLFGLDLYEEEKPTIFLCEGWRDGITLYELLQHSSPHGVPLLDDVNVLAIPGTNSFKADWCSFFHGKKVVLMMDNDHPRLNEKTGKEMEQGGIAGIKKTASILMSTPDYKPESIHYLAWGNNQDVGYSKELPDRLDIRDYLTDAIKA
jgi:hypothetical protein